MSGRDWRDFIIASVVALLAFFIPAGIAWANAMQEPTIGVQQWAKTTHTGAGTDGGSVISTLPYRVKRNPTCAGNSFSPASNTHTYVTAATVPSNWERV